MEKNGPAPAALGEDQTVKFLGEKKADLRAVWCSEVYPSAQEALKRQVANLSQCEKPLPSGKRLLCESMIINDFKFLTSEYRQNVPQGVRPFDLPKVQHQTDNPKYAEEYFLSLYDA